MVDTAGSPGDILRFDKEDIMLNRLPVKLSPHQIGIQEVLFLAEMRDTCPKEVSIIGVIPQSLEAGDELTPLIQRRLLVVARLLVDELEASGQIIGRKAA